MSIPKLFVERIEKDFPNKYTSIIESIKTPHHRVTFRINADKMTIQTLKTLIPDETLQESGISSDIFTTQNKSYYTKNPLIFSGAYYFQDLASTIPTLLLDLQGDEFVLDACASPGSKSTHILSHLNNGGKLIANEINKTRVGRLIENIARWGSKQVFICSQDTQKFTHLGPLFDKILVDAPCSGEGMFYKSLDSIQEWSPKLVNKCAQLQKQILDNLLPCVKEGGEVVYSTCTMSVEENEMVVQYILNKYSGYIELEDFSPFWAGGETAVSEYQGQVFSECIPKYTRRIFPFHKEFSGEAFFIAKFKILKVISAQENFVGKLKYHNHWDTPKKYLQKYLQYFGLSFSVDKILNLGHFLYYQGVWTKQELRQLIPTLHPVYLGCRLGTLKKDWIEPSIEMVTTLYREYNKDLVIHLEQEDIAKYIMEEPVDIKNRDFQPEGFVVVAYQNYPIGIAKVGADKVLKSYFKASQGRKAL